MISHFTEHQTPFLCARMLRKMFIVLEIYKFDCSLECRDQKVSSKAQTSGFEIALLHEKFSPGLIFLHANMHNTQKFPREKTFPKIRLNLSMPLLLWPEPVGCMGTGAIVPTKFWQNFRTSFQSFIWHKIFLHISTVI